MKKIYLILLVLPIWACTMSSMSTDAARSVTVEAIQTLTPSPTLQACQVKTNVESGSLNLRSGPGTSFQPLKVLSEGEPITLLATPARDGWQAVKVDSMAGWVNQKYISCKKEVKP